MLDPKIPKAAAPKLVSFCGRPGRLEPLAEGLPESDGLWVWRTDARVLRTAEQPKGESLLRLACDVAELYHERRILRLGAVPETILEVTWLELAADDSLLVFFKPVEPAPDAARA